MRAGQGVALVEVLDLCEVDDGLGLTDCVHINSSMGEISV